MRVIISGCGFAGLKLARSLNNVQNIEVLLIDKNNFHQFQPLFYQVATGLDTAIYHFLCARFSIEIKKRSLSFGRSERS